MSQYRAYFVPGGMDPTGNQQRFQEAQQIEGPDFVQGGFIEVGKNCKCMLKICSNKVDAGGGIAGHLYITLRNTCSNGTYTYRGGPTGEGQPQRNNCQCTRKRGQLVYDSGLYEEGWVDFPEPGKENCREFEVSGGPLACAKVHKCFEKVGKAVDGCCLNYGGLGQIDSNSNSLVAWLMQSCVGFNAPIRLPGPQLHPGVGHRIPKCVADKLAPVPAPVRPIGGGPVVQGTGTTLGGGNTWGR